MSSAHSVTEDERLLPANHTFPLGLFAQCSKEELLSLLLLQDRLLRADGQRDVDALLIDLSRFIRESLMGQPDPHSEVDPYAGLHSKAHRVSDYLLGILVHVQTRFERKPAAQRAPQSLSSRELTVLKWMKEGKTNWEIARIIGLSERTVRFHVGSIFEKLDVKSRTQAVARALGAGLIGS